jgi:hypothetical protein
MDLPNVVFEELNPSYRRHPEKSAGVYSIDGVYVGQSNCILKRIKRHYTEAIAGRHTNAGLSAYLLDKRGKSEVVTVLILSNNIRMEASYEELLKPKFNRGICLKFKHYGRLD